MIAEPGTSKALAVGTTAVIAHAALMTQIILTPAAADCSIIVYDHPSAASGNVLATLKAPASAASVSVSFNTPVWAGAGLTAVVAGTGALAYVVYIRENG